MIPSLLLACAMFAAPASIQLPKELDRVLRDYERNWRDKDAKGLAGLFTEDGFALAHLDGNLAIIIGAYTYGVAANQDRGKFTLTLKRKSKSSAWLIYSDMDNGVAQRPK